MTSEELFEQFGIDEHTKLDSPEAIAYYAAGLAKAIQDDILREMGVEV